MVESHGSEWFQMSLFCGLEPLLTGPESHRHCCNSSSLYNFWVCTLHTWQTYSALYSVNGGGNYVQLVAPEVPARISIQYGAWSRILRRRQAHCRFSAALKAVWIASVVTFVSIGDYDDGALFGVREALVLRDAGPMQVWSTTLGASQLVSARHPAAPGWCSGRYPR